MPNYRRPHVTGTPVFFTLCLAERGGDLLLQEVPRLREAVAEVKAARPFAIRAWVLLPDHLHAIWELPEGDRDYSGRWAAIKARFSMGIPSAACRRSHRLRREKGLWQRRFWEHHIRDETDLSAHLRYCWANPVKHGLVKKAEDWPYSSLHRDLRLGLVTQDWAGNIPDGDFGERPSQA